MKRRSIWAVALVLAGLGAGCASKGEVRRARADRDRMAVELSETRGVRDQYKTALEKAQQAAQDSEEKRQKSEQETQRAREEVVKIRGELGILQKNAEAAKVEMDQARQRLQGDVKAALDRAAAAEQRSKELTVQRDELARTVAQLKKAATSRKGAP